MDPSNTTTLERQLAKYANREGAVLVGHANTALYLTLRYLRELRGPGDVIVSPIVCPSLVQTIVYAGFNPIFVDVELPLCTIDPIAAANSINRNTCAIIGIHIFGHSANMPALCALAKQHEVWLIEDAAQSLGGITAEGRHGGWGHASLYSFGGSKIISAGGGGALLTDDSNLLDYVRKEASRLPVLNFDSDFRLLSLSHRNLTHGIIDALRVERNAAGWQAFTSLLETYRPLFVHAFPDDKRLVRAISDGIEQIDEEVYVRRQRALAYCSGLSHLMPMIQFPSEENCQSVIWRFTTVVADPKKAISTARALRDAGLHASNHYWSVAELLYGNRDMPNADYASPRLLNLWVERTISMADTQRTIDIIAAQLDQ
jgi:dTDP-4-amino-4,6-dideoxygalactose transaminase